jgi:transposase
VSEHDRDQVFALAAEVQAATGQVVRVTFADQGYASDQPAADAANHGIELVVVAHVKPKRGFVLLPKRWVVKRTFGWLARFRRLSRDYERTAAVLTGWNWVAFVAIMLYRLALLPDPDS